jgi:hypothetical protein
MRFPLWAYGLAAGALLAAGWAVYSHIRAEGYREGFAVAEAACEAEQRKQELANRNAIDAANKQLLERADELVQKELQLDDYVKANDFLAAQEPGADSMCLPAGSVRRLNTIR